VIGTIQATEAIKLILGIGEPLVGRLIVYDALRMRFRELRLPPDPDCPICGTNPVITELRETGSRCDMQQEMTVTELKARMDAGNAPQILDVREPWEVALCAIPGSRRIPLGELPQRLDELDPSAELVVQCKSGRRSATAVQLLRDRGFTGPINLAGGILAWINEIDSTLPRY
jgi:rhodanese-related sulfurtransferase